MVEVKRTLGCGLIVAVATCVAGVSTTSVMAYSGGAPPGTGTTASCQSPNALQALCGDPAGSKGGGGSWRLYSVGKRGRSWDATSLTGAATIDSVCSEYYVAYGYERLHGNGGRNVASSAGHFGIMAWGENIGSNENAGGNTKYNSYGSIGSSSLKKNGTWNGEAIRKAANDAGYEGAVLNYDTALAMYRAAENTNGSIGSSKAWFCIDHIVTVDPEFESSASSSAGSDGYIGEKLTNPPSVTLSGSMTNASEATCTHDHAAHGGTVTCTVAAVSKTKDYKFYIEKDKNPGSLPGNSSYDGDNPWDWVKVNHYALQSLGNNVSVNVPDDAGYVGRKWCASGAIRMGAKESWTERWTERYISGYKADGTAIWSTRSRTTTGTKTYWQPWNISPASCVVIMKKMNAGVAGSSTYAAGGIYGAKAEKHTSKTYGSWAEFLAITKSSGIDWSSKHKGFSSGSALYGGVSTGDNNIRTLSKMSVGNKGIGTGSPSVPAAQVSGSQGFKETLDRIIASGITYAGVNRQEGNIVISSNDTSSNSGYQKIYYSTEGNIYIKPGVTTINAWLIAPNGVIDTCADTTSGPNAGAPNLGSASMQANQCTNKLTINGLVYAKGMRLDRTAGGAGNSVAEVINLTPASYVWAHTQATQTYASPRTVYSRELAPRM